MLDSYMAFVFFFKQNTAYEMRISDWSSDVCSSDLDRIAPFGPFAGGQRQRFVDHRVDDIDERHAREHSAPQFGCLIVNRAHHLSAGRAALDRDFARAGRSEEHTSELQSLMRNSYAVFCLKKKTKNIDCKDVRTYKHTKIEIS